MAKITDPEERARRHLRKDPNRPKGTPGSTPRQRVLAEIMAEKPLAPMTQVLLEAGYAPETGRAHARRITEAAGTQAALKSILDIDPRLEADSLVRRAADLAYQDNDRPTAARVTLKLLDHRLSAEGAKVSESTQTHTQVLALLVPADPEGDT